MSPEKSNRSRFSWLKLVGITIVNLSIVFIASILGVYGDGRAGSMPYIFGVGTIWVTLFAIRAALLIGKNREQDGLSFAKRTIPYAFITLVLGTVLVIVLVEAFRRVA